MQFFRGFVIVGNRGGKKVYSLLPETIVQCGPNLRLGSIVDETPLGFCMYPFSNEGFQFLTVDLTICALIQVSLGPFQIPSSPQRLSFETTLIRTHTHAPHHTQTHSHAHTPHVPHRHAYLPHTTQHTTPTLCAYTLTHMHQTHTLMHSNTTSHINTGRVSVM